ncbi:hypothetical protein PM082_021706 [Marasmius tenuissimus]|nr:hypothetical protein PM082_021706 [Marasmius tenuissimus]
MPMLSEFFNGAKNTSITSGSGTFSHVQGDQYNHTTTIVQAKEKERTEWDDFFDVKRGAIYILRDIGRYTYPRRWDQDQEWSAEEGHPRADKIICTAEIVDRPGMVFTVIEYRGPEAEKAFGDDFAMLLKGLCGSGTRDVCRMYGYNKLKIPSLILYNELMPVAQSGVKVGRLGAIYLRCLSYQLGCEGEELWLDAGRGVICRGPPGPEPMLAVGGIHGIGELPLATELLREDVLLRFLASLKSKKVWKVILASVILGTQGAAEPGQLSRPVVISTLTDTFISIANNVWESDKINLSGRKFLDNGLTRFTLIGGSNIWLWLDWDVWEAWLMQAWSVFRAHGLSLKDNLSQYKLVYSRASLDGYVSNSRAQCARRSRQPIYLFIRTPPLDPVNCGASQLHYWSFHDDGHSPLSPKICRSLGLPIQLELCANLSSWSWSNDDYRLLHQYQLLRGFDPATIDFSQHLGYDHVFQPVGEDVERESECSPTTSSSVLSQPSGASAHLDGLLSALLSPLSYTVPSGSDILTVSC